MKNTFLILCVVILALIACEKQPIEPSVGNGPGVVFNLSATYPDDTKAVKTGWETDYVVFVFIERQTAPAPVRTAKTVCSREIRVAQMLK